MKKSVITDGPGWIYVLSDGHGHFKIGCSAKPDNRIKRLKILLPFPVSVVLLAEVPMRRSAEIQIHEELANCRLNGEWFHLEPEDFGAFGSFCDGRVFMDEGEGLFELPKIDFDLELMGECPDVKGGTDAA